MWSRRSNFGLADEELLALRQRALGPPQAGVPRGLDLSETNPTRVGLDLPSFAEFLHQPGPYEPDPQGMLAARLALAHSYRPRAVDAEPARMCLLSSTSEGYLWLLHLLCDPGDAVLVPSPSYPLIDQLAAQAGVRLVPYQLRYSGGWDIDLGTLPSRAALEQQKIRAVIVVSPNNPTGSFVSDDELAALAELGLPLIVDEVFRPYTWGRSRSSEPLALPGLTFVLDGLSKRAAAPGLKLGWVFAHGSESLALEAMSRLAFLADNLLAAGAMVQRALPDILAAERTTQRLVLERLEQNDAQARRLTAQSAVSVLPLDAGFQLILRLPAVLSEREFLRRLAERRLWLQPGGLYALPFAPALVASLLPSPECFREGLTRLLELVETEVAR